MLIRSKTFAVIGSTMTALTMVSLVVAGAIVVRRARANERADAHRRLELGMRALDNEIASLDGFASDSAAWDDTCAFVLDRNEDYVRANLTPDTFAMNRFSFMVFLNTDGQIVYSTGYDLERNEPRPPPPDLLDLLTPESPLVRHADPESVTKGVLLLDEGPFIVSSRPILTSEYQGPIRGTLLIGRVLDDAGIQRLSELTLLPLRLYPVQAPEVPPPVRTMLLGAGGGARETCHVLTFHRVSAYRLVRDIFDRPALVLDVTTERTHGPQAWADLGRVFVVLLLFGAAAVGLSLGLMDRLILTRTTRLRDFVNKVTTEGDLSRRIYLPGQDELTELGNAFNRMLEALQLDMATRQAAQEAKRQSESLYRGVCEAAPLALILLDRETRVTDWNQQAEVMFGWKRAEVLGKNMFDFLVRPEDHPDVKAVAEDLLQGRAPSRHVNCNVTKDGRVILCEWNNTVLRNREGQVTGIIALGMDITERIKAEEAARDSLARFMGIFERAPLVAIQGFDRDGAILHWNAASERLYGLPAIHAIGRKIQEVLTSEADVRDFEERLRTVWESRQPLSLQEWRVKGAGGDVRTVVSSMFPITEKNRVIEVFCMDVDVTELRRAEEERREIETRMQQTQKLESLGMLAGGLAHDFNNLLMTVLGNADLALAELPPGSPTADTMQEIIKGARRAAELCKQMLAYSGRSRRVVEPLDLAHVIREMSNMLEVAVSKKTLLRFNLADHLPAVEADATQMRQVVMNLVLNAAEAVGDRSGVVAVTLGAKDCDQAYLRDCLLGENLKPGLYVYLEVTDTGSGMDEATLQRVFDPFFTTKGSGRGLGLSTVFGIVRAHRGALRVQSHPGRGTTFRVLLPASPMGVLRPDEEREDITWRGEGTVLIADDEETVLALTRRMLEMAGFTVLTAADGAEAARVFSEHAPDLRCVILDLTMPVLDGVEAFREMRNIKPDVRAILSSGYDDRDLAERYRQEGWAGFLQKPYTKEALLGVLRKILEET